MKCNTSNWLLFFFCFVFFFFLFLSFFLFYFGLKVYLQYLPKSACPLDNLASFFRILPWEPAAVIVVYMMDSPAQGTPSRESSRGWGTNGMAKSCRIGGELL